METVNESVRDEIKRLGAFDLEACYSCGTCSAICPLSRDEVSFPRRMIRYSLLGLERRILSAPEPWLCYYCGECSDSCPRQAEPAALMMALRRFATRRYSLGRIADLIYSSLVSAITWFFLSAVALLAVLLAHDPQMNRERVDFLSFIGLGPLHWAGIALVAFIALAVGAQVWILYRNLRAGPRPVASDLRKKGTSAWQALRESAVQRRFGECERSLGRRLAHLAISWGFMGMLLATTIIAAVDFRWLPWPRWISLAVGSASGVLSLAGLAYYIALRFRRRTAVGKYSHPTDWAFLLLLALSILSGYVMLLFRFTNLPLAAYAAFTFHLVVVFDLLVTFPFSKFAHVVYRPVALWFAGLR